MAKTRALIVIGCVLTMLPLSSSGMAKETHDIEFHALYPGQPSAVGLDCDAAGTKYEPLAAGQTLQLKTDSGSLVGQGVLKTAGRQVAEGMCETSITFAQAPDAPVYLVMSGGQTIATREKDDLESSDWVTSATYGTPSSAALPAGDPSAAQTFRTSDSEYTIDAAWGGYVEFCPAISPAPGYTLVSISVEISAKEGTVFYASPRFSVSDQDGYTYEWDGSCGLKSELDYGDLLAGRRVVGAIVYEVPAETRALTVDYVGVWPEETGSWPVAVASTESKAKPTPKPAGISVDLRFRSKGFSKRVKGFVPAGILSFCNWGSKPGNRKVTYVSDVSFDGDDLGVPRLTTFYFTDTDGPGKLKSYVMAHVADGFDTRYYVWDPVLGTGSGKVTFSNNHSTLRFDLRMDEIIGSGRMSMKGKVTCRP